MKALLGGLVFLVMGISSAAHAVIVNVTYSIDFTSHTDNKNLAWLSSHNGWDTAQQVTDYLDPTNLFLSVTYNSDKAGFTTNLNTGAVLTRTSNYSEAIISGSNIDLSLSDYIFYENWFDGNNTRLDNYLYMVRTAGVLSQVGQSDVGYMHNQSADSYYYQSSPTFVWNSTEFDYYNFKWEVTAVKTMTTVSEPSLWMLLSIGLLGLWGKQKKLAITA